MIPLFCAAWFSLYDALPHNPVSTCRGYMATKLKDGIIGVGVKIRSSYYLELLILRLDHHIHSRRLPCGANSTTCRLCESGHCPRDGYGHSLGADSVIDFFERIDAPGIFANKLVTCFITLPIKTVLRTR